MAQMPSLTQAELKMVAAAWSSMEQQPVKINYDKFCSLMGYKNRNSACACFSPVRKKLMGVLERAESGAGDHGGEATCTRDTAAGKKRGRGAAKGKRGDALEDDDEQVEDKRLPKKRGRTPPVTMLAGPTDSVADPSSGDVAPQTSESLAGPQDTDGEKKRSREAEVAMTAETAECAADPSSGDVPAQTTRAPADALISDVAATKSRASESAAEVSRGLVAKEEARETLDAPGKGCAEVMLTLETPDAMNEKLVQGALAYLKQEGAGSEDD